MAGRGKLGKQGGHELHPPRQPYDLQQDSRQWWKKDVFAAFNQLLSRPWFHRRWVIQEAAFAENSTIFCGDRQVNIFDFAHAVGVVRLKMDRELRSAGDTSWLRDEFLSNFRDSPATRLLDIIGAAFLQRSQSVVLRDHPLLSLETLADLSSFCEAKKPHDAIFARGRINLRMLVKYMQELEEWDKHYYEGLSPALIRTPFADTERWGADDGIEGLKSSSASVPKTTVASRKEYGPPVLQNYVTDKGWVSLSILLQCPEIQIGRIRFMQKSRRPFMLQAVDLWPDADERIEAEEYGPKTEEEVRMEIER